MNPDARPNLQSPGRPQHLQALVIALDSLIFIQLAIDYYQNNLTLLLLLRLASQVFYVQKHKIGNIETPTQLTPVVIVNIICLITHLIHARPEATYKAAHGYIHGGIIIDLIGEKGPISKWRLILHDLMIFGLQVLMLAIGHESSVATSGKKKGTTSQDHEAEEEGVRRSQEGTTPAQAEADDDPPAETEEGIEMQSFLPSAEGASSNALDTEDDLILTLNLRRSLKGMMARSSELAAADVDGTTVMGRATESAERFREVISRLAASRAG